MASLSKGVCGDAKLACESTSGRTKDDMYTFKLVYTTLKEEIPTACNESSWAS